MLEITADGHAACDALPACDAVAQFKPEKRATTNQPVEAAMTRPARLDHLSMVALHEWLWRRRFLLFGALRPDDRGDAVNETFVQTLEFSGKLRDPGALYAACYTIGLRVRAKRIKEYVREDADPCCDAALSWHPEHHLFERQRRTSALAAIRRLRNLDREIIHRFYFDEQSKEQIGDALQLTHTQFRLRKSRAVGEARRRARALLSVKVSSRPNLADTRIKAFSAAGGSA